MCRLRQSAHCLLPRMLRLQLQGTACAACYVLGFVPVDNRLPYREGHRLLHTLPVGPVAVSVSVGSWLGRRALLKAAQRVTAGAHRRPTGWASLPGPGRSAEPLGLPAPLQQQQPARGAQLPRQSRGRLQACRQAVLCGTAAPLGGRLGAQHAATTAESSACCSCSWQAQGQLLEQIATHQAAAGSLTRVRVVPCVPICHGHIPILSKVQPCTHTTTISFSLLQGLR